MGEGNERKASAEAVAPCSATSSAPVPPSARMWDPRMVDALCRSEKRGALPAYEHEDYVQDVLVRLLTSRGYDPRRGNRQAYARIVARSVLKDRYRKEGRRSAILLRRSSDVLDFTYPEAAK